MKNKRLRLTREKNLFFLELCSPPANTTDRLFFQELIEIIPELENDTSAYGCIISGQGRHFSSGADIEELQTTLTTEEQNRVAEIMNRSVLLFEKLSRLSYPVVAAIKGCCLGSGLELAMACHYRMSTKNALFSLPETTFSLMPGCGGTVRLPKLVGSSKAMELILSGQNILAKDALKMGLIDMIVPKKELQNRAKLLISTLQTERSQI